MKLLGKFLGRRFYLDGRGRFFDEMLFFREKGICSDFAMIDYFDTVPWKFVHFDWDQFYAAYCAQSDDKIELRKEDKEVTGREGLAGARDNARRVFMHGVMVRLYGEDEKRLTAYLGKLLDSDLEERTRMCGQEGDYGVLAEASFYLLPGVFVKSYALLEKTDFWTAWERLGVRGYKDVLKDPEKEEEEKPLDTEISLSRLTRRKDEDEFLEFWEGDNLVLSEELREQIGGWKERLEAAGDIPEDAVERYLADVVRDLLEDWGCRYADAGFVETILKNRGDANYRKALVLLRDIMEEDIRYFPELTRRQAMEWVLKKNRNRHDRVIMMAFHSLLTNPRMRGEILGF